MYRQHILIRLLVIVLTLAASSASVAQDTALIGSWQAVELVDNGRVVDPEAIPAWLPSGGRIEIIDNSIVFTAPKDGKRHARVISVDATTYPRQLNVFDDGKLFGHGIYRVEDDRLVVCLSPPSMSSRPTDFSARENSQRVMIVFTQIDAKPSTGTESPQTVSSTPKLTLPDPPSQAAARPLTDAEIGSWLLGNWKFKDAYGEFFLTVDRNGAFSTYREVVETSAFQKVFRKLPLSSGTWKLKNGQVVLQCTSSVYVDRLCKTFPFTIRSVDATDMEFVDYAGNVGKAVRTRF